MKTVLAISGGYPVSGVDNIIGTAALSVPNAESVTWSSLSPSVASVSSSGVVTVLTSGSATIQADVNGLIIVKNFSCYIAAEEPGVGMTCPVGILSSGTLTLTSPRQQLYEITASDSRVTMDSFTGEVVVNADPAGTASCDVTFTMKRITDSSGTGVVVASGTVPCSKEAHLVDLTGKVGYVPDFAALSGLTTVYADFIAERASAAATFVASDKASSKNASFELARYGSISGRLKVCAGSEVFACNADANDIAAGSQAETEYFNVATGVNNSTANYYNGKDNCPNCGSWTPFSSTAGLLGFNTETPVVLAGKTAAEMAAGITAGTIAVKSADRMVKLKRLVIYTGTANTTIQAALANASTAALNLYGTNDGRLISLNATAANQPVIANS